MSQLEEKPLQRVVESSFPARPAFGRSGRTITVLANHFRVEMTTNADVYHYDIAVGKCQDKNDNLDLSKSLRKSILDAFFKSKPAELKSHAIASDGMKNIYAPKKLPFECHRFNNLFPSDVGPNGNPERSFWVQIKESSPCNIRMQQLDELFRGGSSYTPYEAIQALDVALRHTASQRFITAGRSLFQNSGAKSLGGGADLWQGYFQSLRPTQSGLTLNVDTAATAFVKPGPVKDFVQEILHFRQSMESMKPDQIKRASRALRGVKVMVTHRDTQRQYRINRLSDLSASKLTFDSDDGKRQSVAEYFRINYGGLRYPNLPCVHVGAVLGNNYLPMEVCEIFEGQKLMGKLSDDQVASMIKITCKRPDDRKSAIARLIGDANLSKDANVRAFNLKVDPRMLQIQARQLPAPKVVYGKNKTMDVQDGSWNMKGQHFIEPCTIKSWVAISFCDPRRTSSQDIDKFLGTLIRECGNLGIRISKTKPPLIVASPRESVDVVYQNALGQAQRVFHETPQFVLCIKPDTSSILYSDIKCASDSHFGIVSQCMLSKHIQKCNLQYVANLLLKVNVKLGGRNSILQGPLPKVSSTPTIIFGADVTHPAVGVDKSHPSIAAVTASMDRHCSKHYGVIREQGYREEIIADLEEMTVQLLKMFYKSTRSKPQRIIFYRDGVSEGQFQQVLDSEVTALTRAFNRLDPDYRPSITFIIVQKRHHTRFFGMDKRDCDRSNNLRAGTVIEKGICHPVEFDFYLLSHGGIQGTSRPSHYHVLLDENKFTPDELETLTFHLCFNYVRCTKSVSIVPAVYYAHLLAFRARHLSADTKMHHVHANLMESMFFA